MIELTKMDTPARPLIINPAHVASLQPLRRVVPSMVSQTPGATNEQRVGTQIFMVDGTHYNVLDDYDKVKELVLNQSPNKLTPPSGEKPAPVPQSGRPDFSLLNLRDDAVDREWLRDVPQAEPKLDSPLKLAEQGITDGSIPQSEVAGLQEALQDNLADELTQVTEVDTSEHKVVDASADNILPNAGFSNEVINDTQEPQAEVVTEELKAEEEAPAPTPKRRGRPARAKSDTPDGGSTETNDE